MKKTQDKKTNTKVYSIIKRLTDIAVSLSAIIVLSIPMIAIFLLICAVDKTQPIFKQDRVGLNAKTFQLLKFRTMKTSAPKYMATNQLQDPYSHITALGKVLRKLSLDELPQLFNILKGDMSLVGPRPLIEAEKEIYDLRKKNGIYCVKPGLTGLAQINGRDNVSVEEKVRLDKQYIDTRSLMTDLKILLLTIPKVFGSEGVVEGANTDIHNKKRDHSAK